MFKCITTDYTLQDATWEILIMLLVAFILGYLLRWLMDRRIHEQVSVPDVDPGSDMTTYLGRVYSEEDLKIVEGIGPKIETLLKEAGILNWNDLAESDVNQLKKVLTDAGDRFKFHDPTTWADQADLARSGRWRELKDLQDILDGGKMS